MLERYPGIMLRVDVYWLWVRRMTIAQGSCLRRSGLDSKEGGHACVTNLTTRLLYGNSQIVCTLTIK